MYEGSANQITVYIATASKMAAAAMVIRFVGLSGGASVYLKQALVVLCVLSMTFGNLVAIIQKDVKRLLAYSSIAHAGYMLMGILSMTERGYASAIFYAAAYLVMNFACFMVVVKIAGDGRNLKIKELAGLHKRSPLLAMTLMLGLFGLAGIPPTVGFTGKFYVFAAAMDRLRPGSAFEEDFDGPFDIILLTNFLHHFDPPTCTRLLRKCRAALVPGGRVAALEFVPHEDRVSPPASAAFAQIMLATTVAGDAYTFQEYERMCLDAGLSRIEMCDVPPSPHRIVSGYADHD